MFAGGTAAGATWWDSLLSLFGSQAGDGADGSNASSKKTTAGKSSAARSRRHSSRSLSPRMRSRGVAELDGRMSSGAGPDAEEIDGADDGDGGGGGDGRRHTGSAANGDSTTSQQQRRGHARCRSLELVSSSDDCEIVPARRLTAHELRLALMKSVSRGDGKRTSSLLSRSPALITRETIMGEGMVSRSIRSYAALPRADSAADTRFWPDQFQSPLVAAVRENPEPSVLEQIVYICVLNRWVVPSASGGKTLLHFACERAEPRASVVEKLLECMGKYSRVFVNVGINDVDSTDGRTALMKAARQGHAGVVRELIRFGTTEDCVDPLDLDCEDPQTGLTALGLAILSDRTSPDLRAIDPFVRVQGVDCLNRPSSLSGLTILADLVLRDDPQNEEKISSLVALGADPNVRCAAPSNPKSILNYCGWTPLQLASFVGNPTVVAALIQTGALLSSSVPESVELSTIPDENCQTAISIAAQHGHVLVVGYLLARGAKLSQNDVSTAHASVQRMLVDLAHEDEVASFDDQKNQECYSSDCDNGSEDRDCVNSVSSSEPLQTCPFEPTGYDASSVVLTATINSSDGAETTQESSDNFCSVEFSPLPFIRHKVVAVDRAVDLLRRQDAILLVLDEVDARVRRLSQL